MRKPIGHRLLWALVVSLLIHLLMVTGTEFSLPDWSTEHDSIVVTLAPAPQPKVQKKPVPKPAPKPAVHKKPKAKPRPKTPIPKLPDLAPSPPPIPVQAAAPVELEPVTPLSPPTDEPVAEQPAPEPTPYIPPVVAYEPDPIPPPPKRVEIEFSGFNGGKGSGKQLFELTDDGHYKLSSVMSMRIVLFISGSIEQHSEGLTTPNGLKPLTFEQKTTGSKRQSASFDWDSNHVTLDTGKRTDVLDLPPGTQDFLSFMYQFMFVPPLDNMRLNIVTGKKLRTYVYEFEGEESLETKMGALRTVHIAKSSSDSDEKTELWLAMDYRNLPVRIRKTDKDGSAIDLIATRLDIIEQ